MIRSTYTIFQRDVSKFLSSPFSLFMGLLMPIIFLIILGNAMGGTISGIPIGLVQEDPAPADSTASLTFAENLAHYHAEADKPATCEVIRYSSEERARSDLDEGSISAYLVMPSDISPDRRIRLYIDSSEFMVPLTIRSTITAVLYETGLNNPLQIENIYGNIAFLEFFGVSVIINAMFQTTMMGGGVSMIRDRELGIIEGYLVTPVKRSSIVLGSIASGVVRSFIAGFILFLINLLYTGEVIRSFTDMALIIVVLIITSIGISSLAVSLAPRFSSQASYAPVVAISGVFLFFTSGAFYPVSGMPGWMAWISAINPETYAIHALRSIILRGQGIGVIGLDMCVLLLFSSIAILVGIMSFRRTLD